MWALLLSPTLSSTDKGRSNGGMGLANVKKLLEGNDGSIELLSSTTRCTFRLLIPILEAS